MSEWKPGDVAMVRSCGSMEWFRAICTHWYGDVKYDKPHWVSTKGRHYNVVEVRPVAVIDPEDREQVERIYRGMWTDAVDPDEMPQPGSTEYEEDIRALANSLREFASPKPPKPEEPTDLAVRVFAAGTFWAKVGLWWVSPATDEEPREWDYLAEQDDIEVSS